MIKVEGLFKRFGQKQVLSNLNLNIGKGEFYLLIGPNGAGKTTLLKILAGLVRPSEGKIKISGYDIVKDYITIKKILGFIPDTPFLYDNLTVYEFLEFISRVYEIEKNIFLPRLNHYLELFNLTSLKNTLIVELSHGSKQKVVYISNFLRQPKIYLIDEPLVGLDPYSINLIKNLLKQEREKGKTILMCTHLLAIAEGLATRIGILNEGRLILEETSSELKKRYNLSLEEIFLKLTRKDNA